MSGKFTLLVTDPILLEYEGVLKRPKLRLAADVRKTLRHIRDVATRVESRATLDVSRDDADDRFLECAQAGEADYLVTGNQQHFPDALGRTRIINARQLIELVTPKS